MNRPQEARNLLVGKASGTVCYGTIESLMIFWRRAGGGWAIVSPEAVFQLTVMMRFAERCQLS